MERGNQGDAPRGAGVGMDEADIMSEHDNLPEPIRLLMQHTRTPFRLIDLKEAIRIKGYKGTIALMLREIERIEGYNPVERDSNLARELDIFIHKGESNHAPQSNQTLQELNWPIRPVVTNPGV